MGGESKFTEDPKEKIMREILAEKTLYDAQFDRLHQIFSPMLQYLDSDKPRTVLFVDPMKLASARAYGIDGEDFVKFMLKENHLEANPMQLRVIFANASNPSLRVIGIDANATNPCTVPVISSQFRENAADVVVPKSHVGEMMMDMPGLKPGEITTLVNYHEFFHCLHDKYSKTDFWSSLFSDNGQKKEMFADVGASIEMIRRGGNPDIIDSLIVWRFPQTDHEHQTVPALLALKKYMKTHGGAEGLRNMKTKDVLDLCYKMTEEGHNMSFFPMIKELSENMPDLKKAAQKAHKAEFSLKDIPRDRDPVKILEDKAFELGHKITPQTLMQANNALQQEYSQKHEANPADMSNIYMMMMIQNAYMKQVKGTNYDDANTKRGGKLTASDVEEISFVLKKPFHPTAAATAGAGAMKR